MLSPDPADVLAVNELATLVRQKFPAFAAALDDEDVWTVSTNRLNINALARHMGLTPAQVRRLIDDVSAYARKIGGGGDRYGR